MTTIFVDPDKREVNLPFPFPPVECPGLEALTGADFAISKLPINPVGNLDWHVKNRTLFVQRKSGYDVFSFDQTKLEIARMAAIPMQQCFILFIGRCYPDSAGKAVVNNAARPYGDSSYKTFEKLQTLIEARGCKFRQIPSELELPVWIEAQIEALEDIAKEPERVVFNHRPVSWEVETDDIWQQVKEPAKDTADYSLVCGVFGIGPKLVEAVRWVCEAHFLPLNLYAYLFVLTALDENGKPLFEVDEWGDKRRKDLRKLIGLKSTFDMPKKQRPNLAYVQNLGVIGGNSDNWWQGVADGLATVEMLARQHGIKDANKLLFIARRAALPFGLVTENEIARWLGELQVEDWLKQKHIDIYNDFIQEKTK